MSRYTAHRALPLDVVEARALAARVAWADVRAASTLHDRFPFCNGACEAGRSQCACEPTEGASSVSEFLADPPRPVPPPYPWRQLGTGLLVVFAMLFGAHALGAFSQASQRVASR